MTDSWATKIGNTVFKKGGTFQLGSGKPSSTQVEQRAHILLLQNLTEIYTSNNLYGGQHIIYVDNQHILDHSFLPPPSSGP